MKIEIRERRLQEHTLTMHTEEVRQSLVGHTFSTDDGQSVYVPIGATCALTNGSVELTWNSDLKVTDNGNVELTHNERCALAAMKATKRPVTARTLGGMAFKRLSRVKSRTHAARRALSVLVGVGLAKEAGVKKGGDTGLARPAKLYQLA